MTENQKENLTGIIENRAVLDLRGFTAEDLKAITKIKNVACIIITEDLRGEVAKFSKKNVASIIAVEKEKKVNLMVGQTLINYERLADIKEDIVISVGQLLVYPPEEKDKIVEFNFKEMYVVGQMLAPKYVNLPISNITGQAVYYKGEPRIFLNEENFTKGFFEVVEEPLSLILIGEHVFADDIPTDLLKEKIAEIVLIGEVTASKDMIPILQYLCTLSVGELITKEDNES